MKVIARHKNWVRGATISESIDEKDPKHRRYIATIRGFGNFKIYDGVITADTSKKVQEKVIWILDRIDHGDEKVFDHKGYFLSTTPT
jgi:hypothetical protein